MSIFTTATILYVTNTPAAVRDEMLDCFTDVYSVGDAVQIDADSLEDNLDDNHISDGTRCWLNAIVCHNNSVEQAHIIQFCP